MSLLEALIEKMDNPLVLTVSVSREVLYELKKEQDARILALEQARLTAEAECGRLREALESISNCGKCLGCQEHARQTINKKALQAPSGASEVMDLVRVARELEKERATGDPVRVQRPLLKFQAALKALDALDGRKG